MNTRKFLVVCASAALAYAAVGCTESQTARNGEPATLSQQSRDTLSEMKQADWRIQHFADSAYAYAVFPSVGQGAVGIGGAYGRGEVYRNGKPIGHCSLTQGTIGAQLGGQSFSEVIFFQDRAALDSFRDNEFAFDASASAVAAASGASATADYKRGVVVFTKAQGGLMFQAAIGGQKFRYESADNVQSAGEEP